MSAPHNILSAPYSDRVLSDQGKEALAYRELPSARIGCGAAQVRDARVNYSQPMMVVWPSSSVKNYCAVERVLSTYARWKKFIIFFDRH